MKCPECGGESGTLDTRLTSFGTRRRKKCKFCNHRFGTVEITMSEYEHLTNLTKNIKQKCELVEKLQKLFEDYERMIKNESTSSCCNDN